MYTFTVRFDFDRSKGKNKPIRVYFGHIRLVYSSFTYSNSFSKQLVQKNYTFHGYFYCIKFYFDRSKGKK